MEKCRAIRYKVKLNYNANVCFPSHILAYLYHIIKRLDVVFEGKLKINVLLKIYGFPGEECELERVIYEEIMLVFCKNYGMPLQFNSNYYVKLEFYSSIPWDPKKVDSLGYPLPTI